MTGRHIDTTARMLWLTLGNGGEWSVARLVEHWRPTFTEAEIDDALHRLEANGLARRRQPAFGRAAWTVGAEEVPGMAINPVRASA